MRVTYAFDNMEERELFEFGFRHIQTFVSANSDVQNAIRKFEKYGAPAGDVLEEIREIVFDLPELEEY